MLTTRWHRIEDLFHAALDIEPARRESFVDECCADDPVTAAEVRRLLKHHAEDASFVDPPTGHALTHARDDSGAHPLVGRHVGGYVIQRLVGAGGQGMVFEAQQPALGRRVAIKLVSGAALPTTLERRLFEREVRTLARLQHPGIAAIHESGQTDEGQPYFAMEFVDGQPLTVFARDRCMPTRARIELFARVCDAVSYAHQHGVIHRDLKPSNILVQGSGFKVQGLVAGADAASLNPGPQTLNPQPKVLDFGLARFLDGDGGPRTETGRIQGTLPYLSPEQARGDTSRIDARSDVYCLGVLLYELLTDRLPFDVDQDRPSDALRRICEELPRRASTIRRFDRDVEAIVLKSLEKDAARRYQSAAALADDLRRYLDRQPVLARMPSATYQLRKLAARHKLPVVLGAALLVSLFAFAVVATVQNWRISDQRDEAWKARQKAVAESMRTKGEAERATRVARFLESLLARSDTRLTPNQPMSARELIDFAAGRLPIDMADDRPTAAKLRVVLARSYAAVGQPEKAETLLWQAIDELREIHGRDHEDCLDALRTLARQKITRYELDDACDLLDQAAEMAARLHGDASTAVAQSLRARAELARLRGDYEVAEAIYRDAFDHPNNACGCGLMGATVAMEDLGSLYAEMGDFAQAEALLRESLLRRRTMLGERNSWVAASHDALGRMNLLRGDGLAAERLFTQALEICEHCAGSERTTRATALGRIGESQLMQGRLGDAESSFREALELARSYLPAWHLSRIRAEARLGGCLLRCGERDEALPHLLTSFYGLQSILGDEHPETIDLLNVLAQAEVQPPGAEDVRMVSGD